MPKNITTVEELRAHLAFMHAKALTEAFTKASVARSQERMVLK